jgi:hypothetical protein
VALFEANKMYRSPTDLIENKLWSAAVYDWFNQAGELVMMLDGLGLPLADMRQYEVVVRDAINQFEKAVNAALEK